MDSEDRRVLAPMWRYALNKKLSKEIRKAQVRQLCLRVDPLASTESYGVNCGTRIFQDECPFYVQKNWLCLAPDRKQVVGCYILGYCERGYERWLKVKAWTRRINLRRGC